MLINRRKSINNISKNRQKGLSLLEVILALIISASFIVLLLQQTLSASFTIKNQSVSSQVQELYLATQQFLNSNSNYTAIIAGTTVGGAPIVIPVGKTTAGGTVPTGPTVVVPANGNNPQYTTVIPSLQSGGYLPTNFINVNSYDQNYELLVRQTQAGVIEGLLISFDNASSIAIPDKYLGTIAAKIGAYGGYEPATLTSALPNCPAGPNTNGCITGTYGGWETTSATWNSIPKAGHIMATLIFNNGVQDVDYLYRDSITGNPQVNKMDTDINMNGNSLDNVNNLNVGTITSSSGGVVTVNGSVLQVTDNAAPYALLVTGNEYASGNVNIASNEVVGGNIISGGNITAIGTLSAQSIQSTTNINAGTTISAIGNITSSGNITGQVIQSTNSYAPGSACSNYGSYAIYNGSGTDPNNGNLIFCNATTHSWQAPTNISILTTDSGTQANDYLATGTCPLEGAFAFDTADYTTFNSAPNTPGLCVAGPLYFCSGTGGNWVPTAYQGQGCFGQ
jgi:type II secretory pathway pseudopilin PulG